MSKKEQEIWDVFISHASEDKSTFVAPLATAIEKAGYAVWYDNFTLKWGDSLRQSIERGLANSRYGIVVLSKAFFRKRWPQAELDAMFEREESDKKSILPIWHGVSETEVREHCPIVAGRLAMDSTEGIDNILLALKDVIGAPHKTPTRKQIQDISEAERIPDLESLAKNLWWLSEQNPKRKDISKKLEEVLAELSNEVNQSNIVVPRKKKHTVTTETSGISRYDQFVSTGSSGREEDVDFLMNHLNQESNIASYKLVDFSLGLVKNRDGVKRIEHYLHNGSQQQRNYAALFFKRRGDISILREALHAGKIDKLQAMSK